MTQGRDLEVETICIVGPTASGKSSLAERVAVSLSSEVVSVDAMQVYRGMDIGTAKVPAAHAACPIRMIDCVDVSESYSVARFQHEARGWIDGLLARGVPAVLCGGTGLYLDAVIDEMEFPHGETKGSVRSGYEEIAKAQGPHALHRMLADRDPASAGLIAPENVRRVARALEMLDEGSSYAETHAGLKRHAAHYRTSIWAITMDRARLYRRIERRVDAMFESGLVEEVRSLMARGLARDTTAGQAIGYKEVMAAIEGECTMDEARDRTKVRTRHYAKRQLSWLRRDGRCRWLDYDELGEDDAHEQIVASANDALDRG